MKATITLPGLIRWSGIVNMLAGLLYIVDLLTFRRENVSLGFELPVVVVGLLGRLLYETAQLGLVGLYARQASKTGWLGLIGFLCAFIGTRDVLNFALFNDISGPFTGVGGTVFILGYLMLGIATLNARLLPRFPAVLLMTGSIILNLPTHPFGPFPLEWVQSGAVIFGVGLVWLGYALWSETNAEQIALT